MQQGLVRGALVAVGSVVAAVASVNASAAIDVAAAVTSITTDGSAALTAIGGAMLTLAALAVVFKWAKAAIFG